MCISTKTDSFSLQPTCHTNPNFLSSMLIGGAISHVLDSPLKLELESIEHVLHESFFINTVDHHHVWFKVFGFLDIWSPFQ